MKHRAKSGFLISAVVIMPLLMLFGCGGGGRTPDPTPEPAPTVSISISAERGRVRAGQSVKLTVAAQNTGIAWPPASATGGSFTITGNEAIWTPPAVEGAYGFTVTAAADTSKKATAQVTVYVPSEDSIDTWYFGINNNGRIAGSGFYSDGNIRAFLKDGGNFDIFDHPDADDYTYAIGINDSGDILGYYEKDYFLKTGTNYQDIGSYRDAYNQTYPTDYTGINNSGQLSGYFTNSGGYAAGFVKTGGVFSVIEHPDVSAVACGSHGLPCGTWITGISNSGNAAGVYTLFSRNCNYAGKSRLKAAMMLR